MLQTVLYINRGTDASKKYLTKQYEFGPPFWVDKCQAHLKTNYNVT